MNRIHKRNQGIINKLAYAGQIDNFKVPYRNMLCKLHDMNQKEINKITKKEKRRVYHEMIVALVGEGKEKTGKSRAKRYRKAKQERTPIWGKTPEHRQMVSNLYKKAKQKTKKTGIKYSVDHIIPLRGKYVTGLHVYANLQVMPTKNNTTKGNHFVVR